METLKYIIEDKTIASLLGVQNFINDEAAILELVKNAYDARSSRVSIVFGEDTLTIIDDGIGMNYDDIKNKWMHVGLSEKMYNVVDDNNRLRVLAGSMGIGRFALARLGEKVQLCTKKNDCPGVVWETDWITSTITTSENMSDTGTEITIHNLRAKWNKRKVQNLITFLSKTYNDDAMSICVVHPDVSADVPAYFSAPKLGQNCLATIKLCYDSSSQVLDTTITSDEFLESAQEYCLETDLKKFCVKTDMVDELKGQLDWDLSENDLEAYMTELGDFTAELFFSISPSKIDMEKFLYKHHMLPESFPSGVVLYRNAFSISSYEGKRDWLGFGKRSRKSPAAASHPTGSWRVRENQISGKVVIDKMRNAVLQDLSNRQGLDENIYYELFVEVILTGVREFERYRQNIVRQINTKNETAPENTARSVSDKVLANPHIIPQLTPEEARELASEIKLFQRQSHDAKKEREDVETRYKYDVRILNVLATVGLKASSIAHEMRNDRNSIADNADSIILALKEFGLWDELNLPEKTAKSYMNIPYLLESNKTISSKLVAFMNAMLSEIEKKQFEASWQSVADILRRIKNGWQRDYAWVDVSIVMDEDVCFMISEDYLQVIFDNLILNSIQQNEERDHLVICIGVNVIGDFLSFSYSDNGKGLDKKYKDNPRKILDVHETTRKKGHGLGMWIVNNTVTMSGGSIFNIAGESGFKIEFTVGGVNQ